MEHVVVRPTQLIGASPVARRDRSAGLIAWHSARYSTRTPCACWTWCWTVRATSTVRIVNLPCLIQLPRGRQTLSRFR